MVSGLEDGLLKELIHLPNSQINPLTFTGGDLIDDGRPRPGRINWLGLGYVRDKSGLFRTRLALPESKGTSDFLH